MVEMDCGEGKHTYTYVYKLGEQCVAGVFAGGQTQLVE